MTDVTRHRVCHIYNLIRDDVDVNVGVVIFLGTRKTRFYQGIGIALVVYRLDFEES